MSGLSLLVCAPSGFFPETSLIPSHQKQHFGLIFCDLLKFGTMNQSQFLAITCNSLEAGEKSRVHGAIGFGFDSHWLKKWRESFKSITKRSNRNHVITFDSHLKTALLTLVFVSDFSGIHFLRRVRWRNSRAGIWGESVRQGTVLWAIFIKKSDDYF